ncbi:botulinum neurotoxin N-terminal receptor binding domain-containing protein [Tenuifilum thalassicum]|uniref:LamG domain-containing protein n=1 Tax=Tenuifilum thalassicum TaxID=2590900 RepID=A0A7D3XL71_9BACT|nr:hypothetical protein [Tenuifilum thalassicum]QKG79236.1 LamG domain-containing protein [Tenuifilum thalassicum]
MRRFSVVIMFMFLPVFINICRSQTQLDNALVLYYSMNDTVYDESGHGNFKYITKSEFVPNYFGVPSSALYLDGDSNYIRVSNRTLSHFNKNRKMTISFWVNIPKLNDDNPHVIYSDANDYGWPKILIVKKSLRLVLEM